MWRVSHSGVSLLLSLHRIFIFLPASHSYRCLTKFTKISALHCNKWALYMSHLLFNPVFSFSHTFFVIVQVSFISISSRCDRQSWQVVLITLFIIQFDEIRWFRSSYLRLVSPPRTLVIQFTNYKFITQINMRNSELDQFSMVGKFTHWWAKSWED